MCHIFVISRGRPGHSLLIELLKLLTIIPTLELIFPLPAALEIVKQT